jgi:hypothetical protein
MPAPGASSATPAAEQEPIPPQDPGLQEPFAPQTAAAQQAASAPTPPPEPPFPPPSAAGDGGGGGTAGASASERPEIPVAAAFAGGFALAMILKRLAR